MKKGTRVYAWTTILTLLFWTLLPAAGLFAETKPTIVVSTPSNNLVTGGSSVDIQGYVTDATTLDIDNVRVSISSNGFFQYTKTSLVIGTNNIILTARNSAGSTSYTLKVIYDPTAVSPTVVVTKVIHPINGPLDFTDGMSVDTSPIDLECSVSNNTSVTYTVYGTGSTVGPVSVPGAINGTYTIPNVPLNPGDNTIILTVANGTRVVNQPIHIKYFSGGPEITNISPKDGDKVNAKTIDITGVVDNVNDLEVLVNGVSIGNATISDGNFLIEAVSLNPGDNTIEFIPDGLGILQTIHIRYEASPIIVITSPKNYDIVTRDSVIISGKVFNTETNGLTVNDVPLSFNSDGTFSKTVHLNKIENTIQVKAANGNLVNTADLTIYFSGIPNIDISYPISGDTVNTADVVFAGNIFPTDHITAFTIEGASGPINMLSTISGSTFSSLPVDLDLTSSTDVVLTLSTGGVMTANPANPVWIPPRTVTRTVTITSNIGPQITVSSPENGVTVYSNTVTVYGKIAKADFNGVKVGGTNTKVNSDGSFSQTVTLQNGKNEIKIEANLGEITSSKTVTVYYDAIAARSAVVRTKMTDAGEAKAFNDMVKVKLTKGSIGLNTTSVLAMADQDDCENIPSQSALVGPVISVGWNGEKPLKTYKVTLKYDDVVRDNQAHKVSVFHYDPGVQTWTVLGGLVDAKSKTVSVQTNRTGYFAAAIYFKIYDDVVNHWGQRDIEYLVARGAIPLNTTNLIEPDTYISRAEFVMFLVKVLGIQPYHPPVESYSDVEHGSDYYEYIEAALRAGLVSGISQDLFAPDQNLTREEAAVILARAGNMKSLKDPDVIKILGKFTDEKSISLWARNQLAAAVKAKVLRGSADNTFKPLGKTTRAEAAAMIVRLSEILNKTTN